LIDSVWINGRSVPVSWRFDPHASTQDAQHVSFVYVSSEPRLRLTWSWRAPHHTGPIEHRIAIENLDARPMWLPLQSSFSYRWKVARETALEQVYVEKGAGSPSAMGTHIDPVPVGFRWQGTSSTYARDGLPREIVPFVMIERKDSAESGWYVGVEFSGRVSLTVERHGASLRGKVGLNPDAGPFRTMLTPHEIFEAPAVFVGGFAGGRDGMGNVLRPWIRAVLANPNTWKDPRYPLLVNNSWGSGMSVDEVLAKRMIRDSAELGLEMFHIDAGWFRGVGDWYPDPAKFPHGLAAIADEAHRHGLKFGIWVDWAQAGIDQKPGALNVFDPVRRSWLIADVPPGWKPDPFVGRTIDLGVPAAEAYSSREVERIVTSYKLDMLEHDGYLVADRCTRSDHPHAPPPLASMRAVSGSGVALPATANSTDVSYRSVRAYYAIYAHLRSMHPEILLEMCNDGGRMVDFGSASHGDYFSITDTYDPLSNRRAFYDASHVLPPAMLEDYVEKWSTPRIENFRYMLRSGMMGWFTLMLDTNTWSPEQHAVAREEFANYKTKLRPLIRDADLYHISDRPDGIHWDAMEYFDPKLAQGAVYAFHGSDPAEEEHTFRLSGLLPDETYRLQFHDHTAPDETMKGESLMKDGLSIHLPVPNSSEIVFIQATGRKAN
jgi:hypothetical protein